MTWLDRENEEEGKRVLYRRKVKLARYRVNAGGPGRLMMLSHVSTKVATPVGIKNGLGGPPM